MGGDHFPMKIPHSLKSYKNDSWASRELSKYKHFDQKKKKGKEKFVGLVSK